MSGSYSDLPKYPGGAREDRADLLDRLRTGRPAERPEPFAERLRHMIPALVMVAGAAVALFLVVGIGVAFAVKGVNAGWGPTVAFVAAAVVLPVVAVAAAVYERHRRRKGWPG